jgi:rhodanese-related sulfurtransferase
MDINVQELKKRLDADDRFIFIDVREVHEYEDFNLGAKLIPLNTLPSQLDYFEGAEKDEIVVHCRSGARSRQAQIFLQQMGFTNVRNLEGGVVEWVACFGKA